MMQTGHAWTSKKIPIKEEKIKAMIAEMLDEVIAPIDARLKALEAIIDPSDIVEDMGIDETE